MISALGRMRGNIEDLDLGVFEQFVIVAVNFGPGIEFGPAFFRPLRNHVAQRGNAITRASISRKVLLGNSPAADQSDGRPIFPRILRLVGQIRGGNFFAWIHSFFLVKLC